MINRYVTINDQIAKCPQQHINPNCLGTAHGYYEIEKLFGYRINYGIKIKQSWCKKCRGTDFYKSK